MAKRGYLAGIPEGQKAGMLGRRSGETTKVPSDDPELQTAKKANAAALNPDNSPSITEAQSWYGRSVRGRDGTEYILGEGMSPQEWEKFFEFYKSSKNPTIEPKKKDEGETPKQAKGTGRGTGQEDFTSPAMQDRIMNGPAQQGAATKKLWGMKDGPLWLQVQKRRANGTTGKTILIKKDVGTLPKEALANKPKETPVSVEEQLHKSPEGMKKLLAERAGVDPDLDADAILNAALMQHASGNWAGFHNKEAPPGSENIPTVKPAVYTKLQEETLPPEFLNAKKERAEISASNSEQMEQFRKGAEAEEDVKKSTAKVKFPSQAQEARQKGFRKTIKSPVQKSIENRDPGSVKKILLHRNPRMGNTQGKTIQDMRKAGMTAEEILAKLEEMGE